jgi:hypothetical protein
MRFAVMSVCVGAVVCAGVLAGETIAKWEERPFFARRPGQTVPPPQHFATTQEMPEGAEVRIKVLQCPKNGNLDVNQFFGGPTFADGYKGFADLKPDQVLTCKLDKKMKISITTRIGAGGFATCKGVQQKDGRDILTYSAGDKMEFVLEVEVVKPK